MRRWKWVDGAVASYMMDAVAVERELHLKLHRMRNDLCMDQLHPQAARDARALCRRLSEALSMVAHCLERPIDPPEHVEKPSLKVVE